MRKSPRAAVEDCRNEILNYAWSPTISVSIIFPTLA